MLNERFGYKILGIECDEERVKTARKRQEKFFPTSTGSVKFVKHFISISSWEFTADELQKAFHVDPATTPVALVGLHADVSEAFERTEVIQAAIVMPCCYHKMSIDRGKPLNFPLSGRLMDILGKIPAGDGIVCRPFLRLACQQPASRWKRMTEEEHKIHGKNMFQRAILDALTDEGQEVQRIKKCGERVTSSDDFVGAICGFEIRDSITGSIIPWSSEHRSKELCENVILLDRKLAVEEASKGFSCCLVKILDADTSPRCIVLIATKA
uniref:Uncharacterized protein n=2 Tax=Lutzomyia longipalpis TaxID=7200 RepID=A0A1B0CN84_LUTLO